MSKKPDPAEEKPKSGTPEYNAWKVRRHRERQKAAKAAEAAEMASRVSLGTATKLERLVSLIAEAQRLAEEVNRETVASLKDQPLTRETAQMLDAYEGKEMRISFAKVDVPF